MAVSITTKCLHIVGRGVAGHGDDVVLTVRVGAVALRCRARGGCMSCRSLNTMGSSLTTMGMVEVTNVGR
jgi:hypothetical protein